MYLTCVNERTSYFPMIFSKSAAVWLQRCDGCPLGSLCKKSKGNRTIYVNHKLNAYKKEAFLLLTSEEGLKHRSQRPIEPEAVFGQMKADMHYKRFRHFGMDKVYMDLGLFGMGFNLKKYLGIKR